MSAFRSLLQQIIKSDDSNEDGEEDEEEDGDGARTRNKSNGGDEEDMDGPPSSKMADDVPLRDVPDNQKKRVIQSRLKRISLLDQCHLMVLQILHELKLRKGKRFPILVAKYRTAKTYIRGVRESKAGAKIPENTVLLGALAEFFTKNPDLLTTRDESVFLDPKEPVLQEVNSPAIWSDLSKESKELFWQWMKSLKHVTLSANLCRGKMADFEFLAKDVLPEISEEFLQFQNAEFASEEDRQEHMHAMIEKFITTVKDKKRLKCLKSLIGNLHQRDQIDKALCLMQSMLDNHKVS